MCLTWVIDPLIALSGLVGTIMIGIWVWAMALKNAGLVDVFWGFSFLGVIVFFTWLFPPTSTNAWLMVMMVSLSSLRLGWYLLKRFMKEHPIEDARYSALRGQYPVSDNLAFLGAYLLQAVLIVVLSLPFLMVLAEPFQSVTLWTWLAVCLWTIGFCIEALADEQLRAFKADPDNRGKTCAQGLWRYSRHPNYFGQWLLWLSYWVMALNVPCGWSTLYVPALMYYFLTRVTGIAATEAQALKSRGESYREYQTRTPAFFPWLPKTLSTSERTH